MRFFRLSGAACALALIAVAGGFSQENENWPQWRGPNANGSALAGNPPINWDEKTSIRWKVEIPGKGSSTPVVWGNQVFVLTAVDNGRAADPKDIPVPDDKYEAKTKPPKTYHQFIVMALDLQTGKVLWQRVACECVPHHGIQPTHSYAAGSPTTDGKHLYASFGSHGVYCYDLQGNLQWKRDLGVMHTRYAWGEASTPVIDGDKLVVPWDHEGQSYLHVLNAQTGETLWRAERDEPTGWSTPVIASHNGRKQVIVNATNKARGYDLETGKVLWECGGQSLNAIPSPVIYKDLAICMSGYRTYAAHAIPLGSSGDISGTDKIKWSLDQGTPYVPSPLILGNRLYFTYFNQANLSCVDPETGKIIYRMRIPDLGTLYASPTGVDDRIYIVDRTGTTAVVQAGDEFKMLALNRLDDAIDASPVVVGNHLLLRGHRYLYCVGSQ